MEIATVLFFEMDAQGLTVKIATSSRLLDYRTKPAMNSTLIFPICSMIVLFK